MVSVIITHSLAVQLLLVNAFSETKHRPCQERELNSPAPQCPTAPARLTLLQTVLPEAPLGPYCSEMHTESQQPRWS